jgi:hypothetical protein
MQHINAKNNSLAAFENLGGKIAQALKSAVPINAYA